MQPLSLEFLGLKMPLLLHQYFIRLEKSLVRSCFKRGWYNGGEVEAPPWLQPAAESASSEEFQLLTWVEATGYHMGIL